MEDALNLFKKDYRTRFCYGGGNKVDVQQGQSVLKLIQDYFESCGNDHTISSPSATRYSSPVVRSKKRTSIQSQGEKAGLANSVKRARNSAESLLASPLRPVRSRGWSHESSLKPAIHDYIADAEKMSPVSKGGTNNTLKDVEALCKSPAMSLDPEDDDGSESVLFLKEAKSSPLHPLHFDDQNTPAAVTHVEVEKLEGPQTGRDEQVVHGQAECIATSSVQKEKSFSSVALVAVVTGTLGKRYSASMSLQSPPPVKDQDIEIENECEFLIDESDESSDSWFLMPHKNKKSKKDGSATPVSKSQPSEKKKTESKEGNKSRKAQIEALTKQKTDDLPVGVHDFKGTSESDPVSNSEGKVRKSQRQNTSPTGRIKKDALRQDSPNQAKNMSWKPEAEELMLSWSELETKASDEEQCKTRVMPSKDSPVHSAGHQQEQTVSPKKNIKSSKYLQSTSKASQPLVHKKQTAKQKLPKDTVDKRLAESPRKKRKKSGKKSSNKKSQLHGEESSDSEIGEKKVERQRVKLNQVFTSSPHQKLQTSTIQKLAKSEKPKNVLHTLESPGNANNKTPVKAPEHRMDSVKNSKKKQLSAKSSGKIPKKIHHTTRESVCSNPEYSESQAASDSCTVQDMARKKQKFSDVKLKNNKRKCNRQHELQDPFAVGKATGHESGPVLEHCDKFVSGSKSCEEDDTSSDRYEDLNSQVRYLMSDNIAKHKIVLPSNTPNVRRTKRIRLRPLEYWRGERVNYAMGPSGGLVITGIVYPETPPHRKIKQRKDGHKQKRDETRHEIPVNLDHTLGDTSKPTVVLDSETNEEVLLECINTENTNSFFFKDESVEIYKNLNTSAFATGKLILKPLKEKGYQFVYMDTLVFHVIRGKIILTLHKTSYCLTAGDCFYVPSGNEYNIRNVLNEESVLLFTQLKRDT